MKEQRLRRKWVISLVTIVGAFLIPASTSQAADPVLIHVAPGYGVEGDLPPAFVEFKVSLSRPAPVPVSFSYSTATNGCMSISGRGCAYAPQDFVDSAGTVAFASGETKKSFLVPIVPDDAREYDEAFFVDLWAPVNAAFAPETLGGWTSLVGYTAEWWLGLEEGHVVDGLSGVVKGTIANDDGWNVPPTANFTYSCSGLSCSFSDASSDSDGTVVEWFWSFGDGHVSSDRNPKHSYGAAGTYTVELQVSDNEWDWGSTSKTLTVKSASRR
jgi:hypothetical protein